MKSKQGGISLKRKKADGTVVSNLIFSNSLSDMKTMDPDKIRINLFSVL